MKIYDISMQIEPDMPVYKNIEEKRPKLSVVRDFNSGDIHESTILMDLHCGTHLDAPYHVLKDGKRVAEQDLNQVVAKCKVLDLTGISEKIGRQDLAQNELQAGDFLLFKTRNSDCTGFDPQFVYLSEEGAKFVQEKRIIGVGIDGLGIERSQPGHPTHRVLLTAGIAILEGLRLKDIEPGEYFLCAAPLKIGQAEAAPVRALLLAADSLLFNK